MSLISEAFAEHFTPSRYTAELLLNGQPTGVRQEVPFSVNGETVRAEMLWRFDRMVTWNEVGFYRGSRLVDTDRLGDEPRSLVPGDEWVYTLTVKKP